MEVMILKTDERLGVVAGEVYRAERYKLDPQEKYSLIERIPDGHKGGCNQYISEVATKIGGEWCRVGESGAFEKIPDRELPWFENTAYLLSSPKNEIRLMESVERMNKLKRKPSQKKDFLELDELSKFDDQLSIKDFESALVELLYDGTQLNVDRWFDKKSNGEYMFSDVQLYWKIWNKAKQSGSKA